MRPEESASNFVTPQGSLFLFCLYLAAAWYGASALSAVLFAAFLFVTAAWIWGRNALKSLCVSLRGESTRVFPGQEIRFSVVIGNRKHLPLFWLTALLPEPERRIFPVEPGRFNWILPFQEITWNQEWKAERRGIYSLGCLELLSGDGFGLCTGRKLVRPKETLLFAVWPAVREVNTELLPLSAANPEPGADGYLEDLTLLKGSRSYQPGDSVKRINWRVLAQQGRTEVNLYEKLRPKNVTFLLDLKSFGEFRTYEDSNAKQHSLVTRFYEKELEEMLVLAASLITALSAKKCRCGLVLPAVLPAEPLSERDADDAEGTGLSGSAEEAGGAASEHAAGTEALRGSAAAAALSALPAFAENSGLFRPGPEDAVPELLTRLAAVRYFGGPAAMPAAEVLRASSSLGQIFVLTYRPSALGCRELLDRLPEHALCVVAAEPDGEAEGARLPWRVIGRREILV